MLDTGFPRADVENDFLRARRRQFLATLAHHLRGGRGEGNRLVPLDEVAGPLGRRFRPTSTRVRFRWERLALARRRGEAIPPIEVYRAGDRHFVIDGHHRVSIAAATRQRLIDAYVTQVLTAMPPAPRPLAGSPR